MSSLITAEFKKEFEADLKLKKPANEVLQACMKTLFEHNLCYQSVIEPKYFLVHKHNRGGLMLSPHNVHRNAANIARVGADLKQLTNAVCIELSSDGPQRETNIAANRRLIEKSEGLLAQINGQERYLTLGCGHTTAFCKSACAGGKTSEPSLQNSDGSIAIHKVKANSSFKQMLEHGWGWTVIKSAVDTAFPDFSKLAQRALNTANHVSTAVGELEAMTVIADFLEQQADAPDIEKQACASIEDLCIPCSGYALCLKNFVVKFGGGNGTPLIVFLDSIAKKSNCTTTLGGTFFEAITYAKFGDIMCQRPLTRVALALCNFQCQADQVIDGVAKLVRVADIRKLNNEKTLLIENTLRQGWEIMQAVHHAQENCTRPVDEYYPPLGKLFVRVVLHFLDKNKVNEGRDLSLSEIKGAYLADLSSIEGTAIKYDPWQDGVDAVEPEPLHQAESAYERSGPALMSLDEQCQPQYIANKKSSFVDQIVVQQGLNPLGHRFEPCKILSISDHVRVAIVGQYSGATETADVPLLEFCSKFDKYKGTLPVKLVAAPMGVLPAQAMFSKSCLFIALHDAFLKFSPSTFAAQLCFWQKPDMVRTTCRILPHKLVLVPMAPLANIVCGILSSHAVSLGKHKGDNDEPTNFSVVKPTPHPPKEVGGAYPDASWLVPFWWVQEAPNNAVANMAWSVKIMNGCPIPVLENKVEIGPHTQLLKPARSLPKSQPKGAPPVVATPVVAPPPPKSGAAPSASSKKAGSKAKSAAPASKQPPAKKAKAQSSTSALNFFGTPA